MNARRYKLRIVMPVLNDGAALTAHLGALQSLRQRGAELVVVDGGSTDESWAIARPWVDRLLCSPAGRAAQMNLGALDTPTSQADALLFLHADTQLPNHALHLIDQALAKRPWGRFNVRLDSSDLRLQLVSTMMNWRSRITGIATGDQAMFVNMTTFLAANGFANQPLMEDIELSKSLLAKSRPATVRERVVTSARKWERGGIWRTVWLMWTLRIAYFFGASPAQLALRYGYAAQPKPAQASIAILAKAPIPGAAKTRLAPALGEAGAARAQRQFIGNTLHTAQQAQLGSIMLWCAPDVAHRRFRALQKHFDVPCIAQPEGDIGERMKRCAEHHFARTNLHPLLIIGTDCPVLSPGHLAEAARSLQQHDACLIPAADGGYVLLGLKKMIPQVFSHIDWSTPQVMPQTLAQLRQAQASVAILPTLWDVDEPADWLRLCQLTQLQSTE